jgi:hypothetical protein
VIGARVTGLVSGFGAGVGVVDGIDVDDIEAAVLRCAGVASLGSGTIGELATYLPGRRVPGIRVTPELVELEICAAWGPPAKLIASQIWEALATVVTDRPIEILITDIASPVIAPPVIASPVIATGIEST